MPVRMVRGEGAWLWDDQGQAYLDTISGIGVCSLGHAHPELASVLASQAQQLWHTANMIQIPQQENLAERLCQAADMDRAFFCNSGAEATECCFKLARLYGHKQGYDFPKTLVVSSSFHGRTLACLSATDSKKVQSGYYPLVPGFLRVAYDDIGAVEQICETHSDISALLLEPILGEGGVVIPQAGYLKALREICDKHQILLIADEVQTGIGKTGSWFAYQHEAVLPDVVACAKALGNGMPIGACLARGEAAELFQPGSHGSTYGGNPLACSVANEVLKIMQRDKIPEQAARLGDYLKQSLESRLGDHPEIVSIRGKGLMVGIEFKQAVTHLKTRAMEQQMILNVTRDKVIRLLPPLIIDEAICDRIVDTLSDIIA